MALFDSTRAAAEAAAKRLGEYEFAGDSETLQRHVQKLAADGKPLTVITTAECPISDKGLYVFAPADATDAVKAVALAAKRSAVVAVSDVSVAACTAPSDVIDVGLPNVYREGTDGAIVTAGPALHLALEAANVADEQGYSLSVIHMPTLVPLSRDELRRVIPVGRPVVFVVGHPLARDVFEHVSAEIPNASVVDPTIPAMLAALLKGVAPGKESTGKPRFAQRMSRLGTENAFEVLAVVNRLRAEGRDIVSFAIGEPDFPSPANVKRAGSRAIEEDKTHYGESAGLRELREAVAGYMRRTRHMEIGPDNVVVTPGAKPILFNTIMSVVDPGDEVIYPNPGFPIYESLIDFVGAKGVPLPLWESLDFNFDPEEFRRRVTPKTRLIILNTPQNPTGGILTSDALKVVAEVAQERDIWVLSDEVYSQMAYDGEFTSIASIPGMAERTVVLDGFSKTYSMTGWRLGFGVMPVDLARQQARVETNLNSCTATFTQWAGVQALNGSQEESLAMIAEFKRRRSIIVDGLNGIPGFSCRLPAGAFYAFPNVTEACKMLGLADSKALQEHLLFQGNVAALPRTSFGRRNAGETDEYLRFSYATSAALIDQGLERIRKVMGA